MAARASTVWSSCPPTGSPTTPARRSRSSLPSRRGGPRCAFAAWPRQPTAGRLQDIVRVGDDKLSDGHQESYIAVHIKALPEPEARDLGDALSAILSEVRVVVDDWRPMLERLEAAVRQLEMAPDSVPRDLL